MSNHDAVAALPATGNADHGLIRQLLTKRLIYSFASTENVASFVAVDPADGTVPLFVMQNSILFQYDSTDSTTVADGVTCLVSSDGKRFKVSDNTTFVGSQSPTSVLSRAVTAQPVSPAVGDKYLIPTAATGVDWAGKDGKVGLYTAGGWKFITLSVGRLLFIEAETAYVHKDVSGNWVTGVGSLALGANSVTLSNVVGATASFVIKVENMTTNTPPVSPSTGVAYVIGSSPTGAWAGQSGKLAMCLVSGSFTIFAPSEGDSIYDRATNLVYNYTGTAWTSASGATIGFATSRVNGGASSVSPGTGSIYLYTSGTAPLTSQLYSADANTVAYVSKSVPSKLTIRYSATVAWATTGNATTANVANIALLRDGETSAVDWAQLCSSTTKPLAIDKSFTIDSIDFARHVYSVAVFWGCDGTNAFFPGTISRSTISITELLT